MTVTCSMNEYTQKIYDSNQKFSFWNTDAQNWFEIPKFDCSKTICCKNLEYKLSKYKDDPD